MIFFFFVVICISLGSEKLSIWLWGRAQAGLALILVSLIVTAIVLAVAPKKFKERVL
jgi:NADH:ubiquinone oxidoreductase subunit 6 (subunit J)